MKIDNMFRLIATICLVAAASAAHMKGPHPRLDGRIVGGEDVEITEFPYQCSLLSWDSHICGCSIISRKFIVTAAHCTSGSADRKTVRVGSSYRTSGGTIHTVASVTDHPQYQPWNMDYDISIIELEDEIEFGNHVATIDLPAQGFDPEAGLETVCTGWGRLSSGGAMSNQLQAIHIPIIDREICNDDPYDDDITERMFCAGVDAGGKDACQGDSGGPLAANGQLIGVASWGYGCGQPNTPGVYSNVGSMRDFVTKITGI